MSILTSSARDASGEALIFPLSFAQQRLFFLHEWDPTSGTYPFPVNLRLTGPLDIAALRRSLADVVDRHWVLRSAVEKRDGIAVQIVGPNQFRLRYEDLRGLDESRRGERLRGRVAEEATRPFTLAGPLLRGRLIAVGDDEHVLLLTFHHIVFDGWSCGVLAEELDLGYRRHAFGEGDALPPLTEQYGEFAVRQLRDYDSDPRRALREQYWRGQLLPLPERLMLPAERPRPEALSGRTGRTWLHLGAELTGGLTELARKTRITPYMVLLAAYQVVLYRFSGQPDFCIGGASAGRPTPESQALIGTFVNEVVYRSDCRPGDTFRGLLERVRLTALGAYRHDGLPFERLVELLAPARAVGYHPLFQHSLALQPNEAGDEGIRLQGLRVSDFESPSEGSALDLAVSFHWDRDALVGAVDFSTDLWTQQWAGTFTEALHAVLRAAAADSGCLVDELPIPGPRLVKAESGPVVSAPSISVPAPEGTSTITNGRAAEKVMIDIWADVLSRPSLDRRDNFFDIGGDSLLALQVVAKANAAGFEVRVRDLFRWQTVADLVERVTSSEPRTEAKLVSRPVAGSVPLLPIQAWFLSEPDVQLGHWNYTNLYRLGRPADSRRLAAAVQSAFEHHDASRLRFTRDGAGGWRQYYHDGPGCEPMRTVDLSRVDRARVHAALVSIAAQCQGELVLDGGPLMRALHLIVAPDDHRLLVASHHLVTDPMSARIMTDDITTAYGQLTRGEPVRLLAQPNSYQDWARALAGSANTPIFQQEVPHWQSVVDDAGCAVPVDWAEGINDVHSQETMSFELDADVTRRIRYEVTGRHRVTVTEILLATFGSSMGSWLDDAPVLIDMETQGRDDIIDGLDITRTVGWFTALFPLVLATGAAVAGPAGLRRASASYRRVPHGGLGFGLLSHFADQVSAPPRALGFTYLGAFDGGAGGADAFLALDELPPETDRAPWMLRRHELEVGAVIFDGRLEFSFTYSRNRHSKDTIRQLGLRWQQDLHAIAVGEPASEIGL